MLFVVMVGGIFGLSLKYLIDVVVLLLDVQFVVFSLLVIYWISCKYIVIWVLWVFVDIVYVGMFIYKDLFLIVVLYVGFVGLVVFGWW